MRGWRCRWGWSRGGRADHLSTNMVIAIAKVLQLKKNGG